MNYKNNLIIKKIEEWSTIVFFCVGIFVLIFLTQALFLTWLNQFKIIYILISFFISFLLTSLFFRFIKNDIKSSPHLSLAVLLVILLVSLILILFPNDTSGGRDGGMYPGMAIALSKHFGILFPPYLFNTQIAHTLYPWQIALATPTYIVWLATQKVLFGIGWMFTSNVVLIFLGLCSLFLVSSLITKKSLAFITFLLFSTCMPFLWFSKETMTENMAFFLLWFLILSLFLFIKTKKNYFLVSLFLSSWLFSFTRNEGLFMQIPVLIVFAAVLLIRKFIPIKKIYFILLIYISLIVLSFFINNRLVPLKNNLNVVGVVTNLNIDMGKNNYIILEEKLPVFIFQMFSKQNLSLALYSFPLVIILIIVSKKKIVKNKILYICLLGIISLEFLKYNNPFITLEQPWMYRRYLYALLPLGYLSLSILLNKLIRKRLLVLIFCALLVINIVLSGKIITLKNNSPITEKIEKLTQNIFAKDFVIIDENPLGNYYLSSYITYQKEVRSSESYLLVELGNWFPKEKKFEGLSYEKLFLLSNKEYDSYKGFKLKKIDALEIKSRQLVTNCNLFILRDELGLKIDNPFYYPYSDVIKFCSKVNNDIINLEKKLILYELFYED